MLKDISREGKGCVSGALLLLLLGSKIEKHNRGEVTGFREDRLVAMQTQM